MEAARLNIFRLCALVLPFCVLLAFGVVQANAVEADSAATSAEQEATIPATNALPGQSMDSGETKAAPGIEEAIVADTVSSQPVEEVAPGSTEKVQIETAGDEAAVDSSDSQAVDLSDSEEGLAAQASTGYDSSHVNMYRLYNPNSGEHFYTADIEEATSVAVAGWHWEDVGWVAPIVSSHPVYRLYNSNAGDHHYTLNIDERDWLIGLGWNDEGIGWYSDAADQLAVYRQYNPNAIAGSHNFTTNRDEDEHLGAVGWNREGTAWYATSGPVVTISGRWLVTSAWGSLERYWIDSTGSIVRGRLIEATEGPGYFAYAQESGAIVRGKYDSGSGYVYVADNEGRLAATSDGNDGWIVTDVYDGGMQRYYYLASQHAMHSGFFSVNGEKFFGVGGEGYVHRGKRRWGDYILLADNGGHLATGTGWLETDVYDGVTKKYYLENVWSDFSAAKTGLFNIDGKYYFGVSGEGYVSDTASTSWINGWWYMLQDGVLTDVAPEMHARVNTFVELMKAMANDNSHGYDQTYRWGEYGDFDCSSLVIHCLRQAGFDTGNATYTGNMRANLTARGWEWRSNITSEELQAGVILLNDTHHTAAMISTTQLAQASINENDSISGGQPGDQTGKEVLIRDYYDYPWSGVLVPTPWCSLS